MLSEEEKKLLKIFKAQVEKEETEYFSVNVYTQLLYDSHKTVSNLITKLQKENEKYKYLYQKALDNTVKSDKENIEFKKQIDLMAEEIANNITNVCPREDYNYDLDCENRCSDNYKECWKLYFAELASRSAGRATDS